MLPLLLLILVTQVPCAPGDSTLACQCKQGIRTSCVALRATNPRLVDDIERQLLQAARLAEVAARAEEAAKLDEADSSASEPPDCNGQGHHVISRPIANALERHKTLRGLYKPRDKRYLAKGKDKESHCGYQKWHREVDREVIEWLRRETDATPEEFIAFLRDIYMRPSMRERFPHGF
jgi:hypothetical protein